MEPAKAALPTLRELTAIYGIGAAKELSQNFIMDLKVARRIVSRARNPEWTTVEIGPGLGSLSRSALDLGCPRLILIEKDARFTPILSQLASAYPDREVSLLNRDALRIEDDDLASYLKGYDKGVNILGNLPFSISTPLLTQYLHAIANQRGIFAGSRPYEMNLLFQKEVADRIVAGPSTKARSRLSILAQAVCHVKENLVLSPNCFVPKPSVHVSMLRFSPLKKSPFIGSTDIAGLERMARAAFSCRRKTVRNTLKHVNWLEGRKVQDALRDAGISESARAEDLEVSDFVKLLHLSDMKN